MVTQNSALYYTPGTLFTEADMLRYVNDEFNRIANAFRHLTDAGLNPTSTIVDGDITLSGFEQIVLVPVVATVSLPPALGVLGVVINIIRTGTGLVTIDPDGTETISGNLTLDLTCQWSSVVMTSDGSNWVRCS
jgi:hypothetical protein